MPYSDYNSLAAITSRKRYKDKLKEKRNLYQLEHPKIYIPKQFCKQGHDTFVVGRRNNGCVKCLHIRSVQWNKDHIDRKRDLSYKKLYGITLEQYNILLVKQNFSCAICGTHQSLLAKRLNVDHDHATKQIRGLLCWECNKRLGWIENTEFCARATLYIQGARTCL